MPSSGPPQGSPQGGSVAGTLSSASNSLGTHTPVSGLTLSSEKDASFRAPDPGPVASLPLTSSAQPRGPGDPVKMQFRVSWLGPCLSFRISDPPKGTSL